MTDDGRYATNTDETKPNPSFSVPVSVSLFIYIYIYIYTILRAIWSNSDLHNTDTQQNLFLNIETPLYIYHQNDW